MTVLYFKNGHLFCNSRYTQHGGVASIIISAGRFVERTEIVGTTGRITIEPPSHHPTSLTIACGYPKRRGTRKPALELGDDGWEGDWEDFTDPLGLSNPSAGGFGYIERFDYPIPTPAPAARAQPPGQRWDGEKMITYKGWSWSGGNQHGFMYQAQCIHRCMAAGLKEFPQHTRAESMQVCEIIDEINMQCAQDGY